MDQVSDYISPVHIQFSKNIFWVDAHVQLISHIHGSQVIRAVKYAPAVFDTGLKWLADHVLLDLQVPYASDQFSKLMR